MKIKLKERFRDDSNYNDGFFALFVMCCIVLGILSFVWLAIVFGNFISWSGFNFEFVRYTLLLIVLWVTYLLSFYNIKKYEKK